MASNPNRSPNNNASTLLLPEIGPDGLARESPVIAYTEKIIEEEQLQLRKYIEENYSKIRDVERELANLTMEMKLTAGPKKAALEHMRKKIEMSTERIRVAKLKEEQAKKAWEAATKVVQDEEAEKQKLCEDLNKLVEKIIETYPVYFMLRVVNNILLQVQESSNTQLSRLEELKRRLEALNPSRMSTSVSADENLRHMPASITQDSSIAHTSELSSGSTKPTVSGGHTPVNNQIPPVSNDGEGRGKKKSSIQGRVKGIGAVPKGRGPGWTGAGFDVDGRG